jgi:hypothetical protein
MNPYLVGDFHGLTESGGAANDARRPYSVQ